MEALGLILTNEGRYGLAGGLNFFRSIVTFPHGWRPEIA
jgi:hypothetical protein